MTIGVWRGPDNVGGGLEVLPMIRWMVILLEQYGESSISSRVA